MEVLKFVEISLVSPAVGSLSWPYGLGVNALAVYLVSAIDNKFAPRRHT